MKKDKDATDLFVLEETLDVKDLTDETILAARDGDQNAMEKVFVAYKSMVRGLANSYFLVGGDKEDLLQEGMYGLYKAVRDFKMGKTSFGTFAHTCISRQIINAVKRYSAYKNKPLADFVSLDEIAATELVSDSDPLEETIEREFKSTLVQRIRTRLSPLETKVVGLFVKGYSYDEIAALIGKSPKAVDGALQRARKKLC